jgi:hypothetical protein
MVVSANINIPEYNIRYSTSETVGVKQEYGGLIMFLTYLLGQWKLFNMVLPTALDIHQLHVTVDI